jgi:hypothetical protein
VTTTPVIIDYASPASRSSLRLPARSIIRWDRDPDRLRVVQVLSGREGALLALGFAAFTFLTMTFALNSMLEKWHRNVGPILMIATLMAAEGVIAPLVVNQTWRKTILTVTPDEMRLEFTAPFSAGQKFTFPGEQIAGVHVVDREPLAGEAIVPELELRLWSIPAVRLFAGHPRRTLMDLSAAIGAVHPFPPPPLPGVAIGVARA